MTNCGVLTRFRSVRAHFVLMKTQARSGPAIAPTPIMYFEFLLTRIGRLEITSDPSAWSCRPNLISTTNVSGKLARTLRFGRDFKFAVVIAGSDGVALRCGYLTHSDVR